MIHNFKKSLQTEREKAHIADMFYRTRLSAEKIVRFDSDSDEDMHWQRQDIDICLTLKGKEYKISEKFRDKDYGDLYIEVFSKYPHKKGWMHTGTPDIVLYFTPQKVYWISHRSLKFFCTETLFPAIAKKHFEELFESKKTICSKYVKINNCITRIQLIQAHNKDGATWETIGVAVPFELLTKNEVKMKCFQL